MTRFAFFLSSAALISIAYHNPVLAADLADVDITLDSHPMARLPVTKLADLERLITQGWVQLKDVRFKHVGKHAADNTLKMHIFRTIPVRRPHVPNQEGSPIAAQAQAQAQVSAAQALPQNQEQKSLELPVEVGEPIIVAQQVFENATLTPQDFKFSYASQLTRSSVVTFTRADQFGVSLSFGLSIPGPSAPTTIAPGFTFSRTNTYSKSLTDTIMVTDTVEDTIKGVKQGETAIVTAMKRPYKEFCHAIIDAEIEDIDITYYENIFDQHHHVKLSDILRTLAPTLYTCTIDNRIFAKLEGELEHLYEEVHVKMEGKTIQAPTGKTE